MLVDEKMKKICFKCGKEKLIDEFYKHPRMKDGHLNKCKECTKKDTKQNRRKNISYYKEYDRTRNKIAKRRSEQRYWNMNYRNKNKDKIKESTIKYRIKNPEKYRAHNIVNRAIKNGKLFKPGKCSLCNTTNTIIYAHHFNYDKPLDVVWVCPLCHAAIHNSVFDFQGPAPAKTGAGPAWFEMRCKF